MDNVLITGGAGFLGRALLAKFEKLFPKARCTVYSRDEAKQEAARRRFPRHRYVLGDVRDRDALELAVAGHDVVIHAAAMKFVPQGESNVREAMAVNIDGSRNVAMAAVRNGVQHVVGISTDKACQPVNVYGLTKLAMERLFQEMAMVSETKFNLVRYGNVVGSTGSVIPLFQRQAREKGVITLTNPQMTRFWLGIDEAVELVMLALGEKESGTVLIPRLASMTMGTLAEVVGRMERGQDTAMQTIGLRFGEKVHEDLLSKFEAPYTELARQGLMKMYPVMQGPRENSLVVGYNSCEPDRRMNPDEMESLIRGAEVVKCA